jgi:cephalosporin-C deacetylase-like acetyl esterase
MNQTEQTFEQFWSDVLDYCDEVNITPQYAEDEFILDGELYCVSVTFEHPTRGDSY